MEFRILGSLEAADGARGMALGGAKQKAVLAILLLHPRRARVRGPSRGRAVGRGPPDTAVKTVQVYVSRLRKELGDGVVLTRGGGYVLDIEARPARRRTLRAPGGRRSRARSSTATRAPRATSSSRRSTCGAAHRSRTSRTSSSRSPRSPGSSELRLLTLEERIEADLELGRHAALVPELETLVREHPARERLRAQLDARPLPLRAAGGCARELPGRPACVRRTARARAEPRAPGARAGDPRGRIPDSTRQPAPAALGPGAAAGAAAAS